MPKTVKKIVRVVYRRNGEVGERGGGWMNGLQA